MNRVELSEEATIAWFQELVNSGLAWQLQGSYGRTASALLRAGMIVLNEAGHQKIKKHVEAPSD